MHITMAPRWRCAKSPHLHSLQVILVLAEVNDKEKGHWQLDISLEGVLDGGELRDKLSWDIGL